MILTELHSIKYSVGNHEVIFHTIKLAMKTPSNNVIVRTLFESQFYILHTFRFIHVDRSSVRIHACTFCFEFKDYSSKGRQHPYILVFMIHKLLLHDSVGYLSPHSYSDGV